MSSNSQLEAEAHLRPWLSVVIGQIESLQFGVVQVLVHDGKVVQIDTTNKVRLGSSQAPIARQAGRED